MAGHLRLVTPAGPKEPKKKRPRSGSPFTPEEQARLRAALKNARKAFGSWAVLADALRVGKDGLEDVASGHRAVSGSIAVRLSMALKVPLEALYKPGLTLLKRPCPTCGGDGGAP